MRNLFLLVGALLSFPALGRDKVTLLENPDAPKSVQLQFEGSIAEDVFRWMTAPAVHVGTANAKVHEDIDVEKANERIGCNDSYVLRTFMEEHVEVERRVRVFRCGFNVDTDGAMIAAPTQNLKWFARQEKTTKMSGNKKDGNFELDLSGEAAEEIYGRLPGNEAKRVGHHISCWPTNRAATEFACKVRLIAPVVDGE